jgi:hypothetical protein
MALLTPLSVTYDADPRWVETVVREEVLKAAGETPGLPAGARALRAIHPGLQRSLARLHAHLSGGDVRRSVPVDPYLVQRERRGRVRDKLSSVRQGGSVGSRPARSQRRRVCLKSFRPLSFPRAHPLAGFLRHYS